MCTILVDGGFVGELKSTAGAEPDALVYSHKQLDISYNGDRVSEHMLWLWVLQCLQVQRGRVYHR
jgi:hypothetical protein